MTMSDAAPAPAVDPVMAAFGTPAPEAPDATPAPASGEVEVDVSELATPEGEAPKPRPTIEEALSIRKARAKLEKSKRAAFTERSSLATERAAHAADLAELAQLRELRALAKTDPAKFLQMAEVDTEKLLRAGSPEEKTLELQRKLEAYEKAAIEREKAQAAQAAQQERAQHEADFSRQASVAETYPDLVTYAKVHGQGSIIVAGHELAASDWRPEHGDPPTRVELLQELQRRAKVHHDTLRAALLPPSAPPAGVKTLSNRVAGAGKGPPELTDAERRSKANADLIALFSKKA